MSKSAIYAANTASQTVASNGVVNFGSPVRRFGQNLKMSGGNVVVQGSGYYEGDANISFTATAGALTVQVYKDGVAIEGATANITAVANVTYQVAIPFVFRQMCCSEDTITVVISGQTATISNAAIVVEKL